MAVLLIDCGRVTLKSPPSRGSDAPHVHQRPRKHLSRCTLDCGSKTSESPALRGFVAGLRALATAALYLCFNRTAISIQKIDSKSSKSHLKSLPRISPKSYRHRLYLKPFLIAIFNFSHKRPTFAFTPESGYTLAFQRKIAHNGSHAETGGLPFCEHSVALRCQRNTFYSTVLLYTYISRFSVNPHYQQKRNIRQSCRHKFYPQPLFIVFFNFLHKRPTFAFTSESGHTERLHTTAHTAKHGAFRMGALLLPSERSTRFGNPAWPGFKTANFAAFGSWSETLLKNAESLRSSDALMRVAAPKASRPRWAA